MPPRPGELGCCQTAVGRERAVTACTQRAAGRTSVGSLMHRKNTADLAATLRRRRSISFLSLLLSLAHAIRGSAGGFGTRTRPHFSQCDHAVEPTLWRAPYSPLPTALCRDAHTHLRRMALQHRQVKLSVTAARRPLLVRWRCRARKPHHCPWQRTAAVVHHTAIHDKTRVTGSK